MKKTIFYSMIFSLIFASTSVTLAEEPVSSDDLNKPVPTLYSSDNSDDSYEAIKPISAEWMRGTSTNATGNANNMKIEEKKREEAKKKLEADKKNLEAKLEQNKKQLEKISSPAEISLFEKIQKIGTALWGVKKVGVKDNSLPMKDVKATSSKANLEKISSPAEISLFEKIQKIGTALWGIKKIENKIEVRQSFVKPVAVQCTKDAINKKDTALQAAISSRTQSIVGAIEARNACQNTALDKLTAKEQFEANKACVEAYQKSGNEYNKILEKSKNESWNVYKTDLKACSALQKNSTSTEVISSSREVNEEIMINDGEEANLIK